MSVWQNSRPFLDRQLESDFYTLLLIYLLRIFLNKAVNPSSLRSKNEIIGIVLSVVGVSGLVWVYPVGAETKRQEGVGAFRETPLQIGTSTLFPMQVLPVPIRQLLTHQAQFKSYPVKCLKTKG